MFTLLRILSLFLLTAKDVPMVVVFGRPGAGKSAVADECVQILLSRSSNKSLQPIGLDLDVCVPQWMRDNFAKGLYPTLEERIEFVQSACGYVEEILQKESSSSTQQVGAVVSFSFVNTDLRDIFRERFPKAGWFLVDTSEEEAAERILKRQGHFYKGKVETPTEKEKQTRPKGDNSEWDFAPVKFPHTSLDGMATIKQNAEIVANGLLELCRPLQQ